MPQQARRAFADSRSDRSFRSIPAAGCVRQPGMVPLALGDGGAETDPDRLVVLSEPAGDSAFEFLRFFADGAAVSRERNFP
jgi:hypothetical protein